MENVTRPLKLEDIPTSFRLSASLVYDGPGNHTMEVQCFPGEVGAWAGRSRRPAPVLRPVRWADG